MIFPLKDWQNWSTTRGSEFGDRVSWGYHEGVDLNLKSGGDTDLGQPIFAISSGVVTSVHSHTKKPSYGKHIWYQCDGEWGTIWDHHAHCLEIFVKEGDKVSGGQKIATIGKSGLVDSAAHDHWTIAVKPVKPDAIARTQEDLKKWTNPVEFVLEWSRKTGGNMDWLTQYFDANFQIDLKKTEGEVRDGLQRLVDALNRYENAEEKSRNLESELEGVVAETAQWEERYSKAYSRGEELDAQVKEKNRVISDKDQQLFAQTRRLEEVEGKILLAPEEYERLASKECLKRYTRFQLLWEALKPKRG